MASRFYFWEIRETIKAKGGEKVQRAYVVIETTRGKHKSVVDELRSLSCVVSADVVTGPYDAIAVVQASDANAVARFILNEVRQIPGVSRTMSCLAVDN